MGGEATTGIRLRRTAEKAAEIDALARRLGGRVELPVLLGDLNRQGRRSWAPGRSVRRALTWDAADRRDRDWWPQGITTSADADHSGLVHGRRLLVTSWYSKHGQGVRLSFFDPETRRYRHVLLVEPTSRGEEPGVRPLKVHAGGIVWHGPYLHVAATAKGIAVCHVDDLLRVPDAGVDGLDAHHYRYLLPVRFWYAAEADDGTEPFRYSFISAALTRDRPELIAGEYGNSKQTRRLARFGFGADHLLAADPSGEVRPTEVHADGPLRMQGAVLVEGQWSATTSHGPWTPGSVWSGRPGLMRRRRWAVPMGPEDLTYAPRWDERWTVTEHPRRRWIVSLRSGV
ncbi:hypothetical protein [Nocardioides ferulae]|uniref:hypothetical protein n=1 Tax=Nocardioides ferulae TaxID=2340821 RepID=UPI000EAC4F3D|nr:hypothetical protein [Nocardioides ferulae]